MQGRSIKVAGHHTDSLRHDGDAAQRFRCQYRSYVGRSTGFSTIPIEADCTTPKREPTVRIGRDDTHLTIFGDKQMPGHTFEPRQSWILVFGVDSNIISLRL